MARVKNNNEYRTKVGNLMRNALESNPNNKKMLDYSNTLEQVKVDYKNYFDKAKTIVKRAYPKEHCERNERGNNRHLVFMTYLNDVEDKGETEFVLQNLKVKAEKGKTVIWPSDWTHTHRGIISPTQEKYIVTGWFSFVD